jgi:hypothetical protein
LLALGSLDIVISSIGFLSEDFKDLIEVSFRVLAPPRLLQHILKRQSRSFIEKTRDNKSSTTYCHSGLSCRLRQLVLGTYLSLQIHGPKPPTLRKVLLFNGRRHKTVLGFSQQPAVQGSHPPQLHRRLPTRGTHHSLSSMLWQSNIVRSGIRRLLCSSQ